MSIEKASKDKSVNTSSAADALKAKLGTQSPKESGAAAPQSAVPAETGKVTVSTFTNAVQSDVKSAKEQMRQLRLAAEQELLKAAQQEAAEYQQFKGGLATAFAGFLGAAEWEPITIEFEPIDMPRSALASAEPKLLSAS